MNKSWTERSAHQGGRRPSAIDEILASREPPEPPVSRYGEDKRSQKEREVVRETYLAIDVRLRSGEYYGLFYFDLAGSPRLSADHTTLLIPFRELKVVIHGYRLLELYRAVLHHSLDILEETPRAEFDSEGKAPVISSIEIVEREEVQ